MLKELRLSGIGPVAELQAHLAERVNVLTGDNGLGKSFLLDIAWWALTGTWAGRRTALPDRRRRKKPTIAFQVNGKKGASSSLRESQFDPELQDWPRPRGKPVSDIVIYGRVDGGFSIWDPARNFWRDAATGAIEALEHPRSFDFDTQTLWSGLRERSGRTLCNGLIHDWVYWQNQPARAVEQRPFPLLKKVIEGLSHPDERMTPGEPMRVYIDDATIYPTLSTPYDPQVPLTQAAAGVRRILGLAYLLVWTWNEHNQAAVLRNREPADQIVLLIDEIESHLHPKWQRTILPSLLSVIRALDDQLRVQIITSTHSPLVLASLEPFFDDAADRLFWFDLEKDEVHFKPYDWATQGDVDNWLTSDVFGLKQARSNEAEQAVEAAERFMAGERTSLPIKFRTKSEIDKELKRLLPSDDPVLIRWRHQRDQR